MGYLTENRLDEIVDLPVSLSSTLLAMGDWLVVATVNIQAPMRISCRILNLNLSGCSVDVSQITANNKIYGNLGLAYLVLQQNYVSGSPGVSSGLDTIVATGLGLFSRNPAAPVISVQPGNYSWIIANNMQPSTNTSDPIPATTSIDFVASALGSARLELSYT